jgi:protein TonB
MAVSDVSTGGGQGSPGGLSPETGPPASNYLRAAIVVVLGVLTSFALFWVMQALISVPAKLDDAGKKLSIDFVRLRKDTTPPQKEREKPKRQKPEQQPPPPEMNVAKNMNPGDAVGEIVPMIDTSVELAEATNLTGGGADRAPVPLVQIQPEYPERARQQKIEGWVDLMFTISAVGTVADPKVVKSKPPVVFDRAALEAVRRWKYNPMVKDGVPVAQPNVYTRLMFELPKGSR